MKQNICKRCVMDLSVADIVFHGEKGCNYCLKLSSDIERSGINNIQFQKEKLEQLIKDIKRKGRGKKFDCIVGVSGGVDSSWVLIKAIESGLRPLAVHMDNGWNSELAQNNIANLVNNLDVELYTHVIDWAEYKGLMQAFFDADVLDVELLYDNAMLAVNYFEARKHGIKYILSGDNTATEGMKMPPGWNWFKFDKKNIISIGKNNKISLETFPAIGTLGYFYYEFIRRINWVHFLDLFNFNKSNSLDILEKDYGYKRYPYKHYESIFTRFYQGYILPQKFGVDKRKMHLSNLIVSGQMTREEALNQINQIPYPSHEDLENDIKYFLKKMDWSEDDLKSYIKRKPIPHDFYKSEKKLWEFAKKMHSVIIGQKING